ncbi:hypothetical protein [Neoaquamicrobium sediminum]|uniref:hypothetical protein n=1 Tax=Neoaquamicrobium sediminum TaxID=1849104 RepID=UPI001563F22C|nr:hypothetical protein [Mesorhizobium sediminum]NRC55162.1 hypothetical protein [Mesorhizobium sediminum]
MSARTPNEDAYFDALHRKTCILESMIEVIFDRVSDRMDDNRDFVVDNLLDAAREITRELPPMVLEDPEQWQARP